MADPESPGRLSSGKSKPSSSGKGHSKGKSAAASPVPNESFLEGSETKPPVGDIQEETDQTFSAVPEKEDPHIKSLGERLKKCVALSGVTKDSWSDENNRAVDKFITDATIIMLVVYLDPFAGLCVQYSIPSQEVEQLAYFIREEEAVITEESFQNCVQFGTVRGGAMESLLRFMNGVYVPQVVHSQSWPESIKNTYLGHMDRFLTELTDCQFKLEGRTVFYIPMDALQCSPDGAARDKGVVQRLEVVMIHWTRQIKEVLKAQEKIEIGDNAGPLDEITFWKSRCADLSDITKQLQKPGVCHIQAILELSKSPYVPAFCSMAKQIQDGSLQAQSNLTFLSLLKGPCEELVQLKPHQVKPKLTHILSLIRIIWTRSPHYNTHEKITSLLCK
ncbi:dynein axonemal heavy chain 2-like, partial [Brachyhypopomus gauderio]|uniref:dynein axonemal heavy chain 2-like n=1 Tax=Brachyhypopomus gauderio TaxID=698409 RepID=UPI0040434435